MYITGTFDTRWDNGVLNPAFHALTASDFEVVALGWTGAPPTPQNFHTLAPCRAVDTRNTPGPAGGPALASNANRGFVLRSRCGIPASARAVSLNVTVTQPASAGHLRVYPGSGSPPGVSTINYRLGQTRANNAIVGLGLSGEISVRCVQAAGTAHLVLDVNGYFD